MFVTTAGDLGSFLPWKSRGGGWLRQMTRYQKDKLSQYILFIRDGWWENARAVEIEIICVYSHLGVYVLCNLVQNY